MNKYVCKYVYEMICIWVSQHCYKQEPLQNAVGILRVYIEIYV